MLTIIDTTGNPHYKSICPRPIVYYLMFMYIDTQAKMSLPISEWLMRTRRVFLGMVTTVAVR